MRDSQSGIISDISRDQNRILLLEYVFIDFSFLCAHLYTLLKKNRKVSCQRDGKGEQKQEEYAAVNPNLSLKESSFTALWTLLQILGKILVKHEHTQQWFYSMGFKEAAYKGCGLEAKPRSPSFPGESLLSGEMIRLVPVLNTPLQGAEIDRCM